MDAALVANLLLAAAQTFDSLTTCRLVNLEQFGDVLDRLSDRLIVEGNVPSCDILEGWKLHSINNTVVSSPDAHALQCPRVKGGQVSLLFFEYGGRFVRPNSDCAFTVCCFFGPFRSRCRFPSSLHQLALLYVLRMPSRPATVLVSVASGYLQTQMAICRRLDGLVCSSLHGTYLLGFAVQEVLVFRVALQPSRLLPSSFWSPCAHGSPGIFLKDSAWCSLRNSATTKQ